MPHYSMRKLIETAEAQPPIHGKALICLETATGSLAQAIYTHLDWRTVGVIPNYALFPDSNPCATTFFYKGP